MLLDPAVIAGTARSAVVGEPNTAAHQYAAGTPSGFAVAWLAVPVGGAGFRLAGKSICFSDTVLAFLTSPQ